MSFNTYLFVLVFFPIAIVGYHLINKKGGYSIGKWFLLFMSIIFYSYAGIRGILTIGCLVIINYSIYRVGLNRPLKKWFLTLGIVVNVLSLFFFKYFVATQLFLNQQFGTEFTFFDIIAPLGISFITFSQISFLVDSYREWKEVSFLDYSLFVLFFPKVTVGPIALASDFIPQFNDTLRKTVNWDNISKGLYAFSFGLAKKVLIADVMSKYANWGFSNIEGLGTLNGLIVMLAYTMQIYFDFSGFCDMALGICLMLNFDLPVNFDSPYRATSIGEFWDRWHITLTKFFTKYVYIPLGGNRKGVIRTYLNILIVFLVSGIWHGAAMTFVVWGLLHGVASCFDRALKNVLTKVPKAIKWFLTFLFVNIAWIFFRAATLVDAVNLIKEVFSFKFEAVNVEMVAAATPAEYEIFQLIFREFGWNTYYTGLPMIIAVLVFAVLASILMKNTSERIRDFKPSSKAIAITVVLLVWSITSLSDVSSFIYVNF